MTDRIITSASLALCFAVAIGLLALSACAPAPHAECSPARAACPSSLADRG